MTKVQAVTDSLQNIVFETQNTNTPDVMLFLAECRNDDRIWSLIRLVLEYDREKDLEEKVNIQRTINEILTNQLIFN